MYRRGDGAGDTPSPRERVGSVISLGEAFGEAGLLVSMTRGEGSGVGGWGVYVRG